MKKQPAFTLIELLVVITIIGILAGMILVFLQNARVKARDARRQAELTSLANVLDQYFIENDKYPKSSNAGCQTRNGLTENIQDSSCGGQDLIAAGLQGSIPADPLDNGRFYEYTSDGTFYTLSATLENGQSYIKTSLSGNVLVVVNDNVPDSVEVGQYYLQRHGLSQGMMVHLQTTTNEMISYTNYVSQIRDPIRQFLEKYGLKNQILYLVTTYGVPYKVNYVPWDYSGWNALDSFLADLYDDNTPDTFNPYNRTYSNTFTTGRYRPGIHFNSSYGIYLVMRLDGPSAKIAKGLVDKAIYAGKYTGPETGNGYMVDEAYLNNASAILCGIVEQAGYTCYQDPDFPNDPKDNNYQNPLWHVRTQGWPEGNNYVNVWPQWPVGAVPMNFRSGTAVATIRNTATSLAVPNYLAADVTGTWGDTDEPSAYGMPQPTAFYDYFLNGHFNLAESIYMSSYYLKWRWFAVGDPLYTLSNSPSIDNEPPQITNLKYQNNIVSWDNFTSQNGSPEVTYGCVELNDGSEICDSSELASFGTSKNNYLSQHSISVAGKTPTRVKATDPAGNVSQQTL